MTALPVFDGTEQCPWCEQTPPANQPKTALAVGTTVQYGACTDCAVDRDNLLQPRREKRQ